MTAAAPPIPDGYRLLRPLGGGGMGEVYLVAGGPSRGEKLALKVSRPGAGGGTWDGGGRERFRREFLALSRISHPSLPRVRDFGLIPGAGGRPERWFFTYDFVDGLDLLAWSDGRPPGELLAAARQLIEVLSLIHSRGLLHLDVKPSNIIVEGEGPALRARLIDFGVVRGLEPPQSTRALGTLPYMAPEVLRGEAIGPAADFFSLGATLFECLFRERPFSGETVEDLRRAHRARLPAPPPGRRVDGADELETLIWRLLAADPARRLPDLDDSPGYGRALGAHLLSRRPVGMKAALEALYGAYGAMAAGKQYPSLVLIEGEAGVGKTRLIAEFKDMVQVAGGRFIALDSPAGGRLGQELIVELAEGLKSLAGARSRPARAYDRRAADLLEPPAWESEFAQARIEQARMRYLESGADLLRAAAGSRPLVVALENVHRSGELAGALLSHLARGVHLTNRDAAGSRLPARAAPAPAPVLLCVSYRPEEVSGEDDWIQGLAAEPFARRVRLRPLSRPQMRALLHSLLGSKGVSREMVDALFASSRGNPFVAIETLKSLIEEGAIRCRPGRPLEVLEPPESWRSPSSVTELLVRRWDSLSPAERRLAASLAAAIGPIPRATALEVSPLEPGETARLLDRLVERIILMKSGQGRRETIAFAHPSLQELAGRSLDGEDRRQAHRRLALVREKDGAPAEELAVLFTGAGDAERALERAREASAARARVAAGRLRDIYDNLLGILPAGDPRRLEVSEALAGVRSLMGDHRGAASLLESLGAGVDSGIDSRRRARWAALLANEHVLLRQLEEARAGYQECEHLLASHPGAWEERIRARLGLCRVEVESGDYGKAIEIARDCAARIGASPPGPARDALECAALARIGSLEVVRGDLAAAIDAYRRGYALARRLGDGLEKGGLACNLGNLHSARGEYDQAVRHYLRARRVARRIGARDLEALVSANLGLQHLYRWDLEEAEAAVLASARLAESIDARRYLAFARLCQGTMLARRGDLDESAAILEEALRGARRDRDPYLAVNLIYQLVKVRLDRGELDRAFHLARAGLRLARRTGRAKSIIEGHLALGAVHLHAGAGGRAVHHLEAARSAPAGHHPHIDAEILLYIGLAKLRSGAPGEAEELLRRAVRAFTGLRIPLRVCEARAGLAAAVLAAGRGREARGIAERAWKSLRRLPRERLPLVVWAEVLLGRARLLLEDQAPGGRELIELFHDLAEAREILARSSARRLLWQATHWLAVVNHRLGDDEKAAVLIAEARRGLEELLEDLPPLLAEKLRESPEARALEASAAGEERACGAEAGGGGAGAGGMKVGALEVRLRRLEDSRRELIEENRRLRRENEELSSKAITQEVELARRDRDAGRRAEGFHGLVGGSPPMQRLFELITRLAATDLPLLVRGETGSGKDLVLKAIHRESRRRGGPFIVECLSAIPEGLIESELFGHARGAFSGAAGARQGLLPVADGGTLCLSGIDELPLAAQRKLLRVLETGAVRPLGGEAERPVNFRLLSSARSDLKRVVAEERFLKELLYRIRGAELVVPPLRDRREDIPLLVEHFLSREMERSGRRIKLEAAAVKRLVEHDWPGNVRELENEIRRLAILGPGRIRAGDLALPPEGTVRAVPGPLVPGVPERLPWAQAHLEVDRAYMEYALGKSNGNLKAAARYLGVHERTVYKIRKRLGL